MMNYFMIVLVAFGMIWSVPGFNYGRKLLRWRKWEYGVPVYGIVFWVYILEIVGRDPSVTNLIWEIFLVLFVSIAMPWIRIFLAQIYKRDKTIDAVVLAVVPIIFSFILRFTIPTL